MKIARIFGFLFIVAGIAAILLSNYISEQVREGKIKIAKGEQAIQQSNQLFSFNPAAKQLGQSVTKSGQKKIDAGKEQITHYQDLAQSLMTGGVIAIVVGAGIVIYSYVKTNKNRKRR